MASITDSTWRQYEKVIHLWWNFCQEKSLSMYEPDSTNVIEFFTQQEEKVKFYSTLNTYRAAISMLMSNRLGNDPDISRFFRGVANKKPVRARYTHTWDPSTVLDHLATWMPNEELNLEKLTKKLVTLLALSTAQRAQTLFAIRLANITTTDGLVKIHVTDRLKTSRHLKAQPVLDIPFFTEQISICPASTLQAYLEKTAQLRPSGDDRLFITFKKPYHAATTQSISRWIKATLEECGIDVTLFSGHSTRHASTSAAVRRGISIEAIKRTAGWSKNSEAFAKFYNRPLLKEDSFSAAILKKH